MEAQAAVKEINGFAVADLDEACGRIRPALKALDGASIFLTGGTGFFGRWLLALLANARASAGVACDVTVLTRSPELFAENFPDLAALPWLQLCEGDIRVFEFPKGRFTHIVHAATDTSASADRNPRQLIASIVDGTRRVIEFAGMAGVKRLLYVSSGAVYGAQPGELERIPETFSGACDPLDSKSSYGQAKRLAEHFCALAASGGLVEAVVARAFAFVGPGLPLDGHFAIGNFIADALAGRRIAVKGDGTALRSYLYAADLSAWLVALLVNGRSGEAYNVGSDAEISIADLAGLVARRLGAPGVDIAKESGVSHSRSRYIPSIDKARRELGLDAWTGVEEAIARTAGYTREHSGERRREIARRNEHAKKGKALTFVVDVDGVVASLSPGNDYALCQPLNGTIERINRLYERGHRIVMFTARGSATGLDWSEVTRDQFARWGLKFHELHFGKPAGDYYIDDRLISLSELDALSEA
jgi:dTDP-glucose 4,6-dehydratase